VSALYLRADLVEEAVRADTYDLLLQHEQEWRKKEREGRKQERDRYDDIE
jgi:hypothetical protein